MMILLTAMLKRPQAQALLRKQPQAVRAVQIKEDEKMKKINLALASVLVLTLAGCTDATAKISDAKTALITVGKTTVTKGSVYSLMNSSAGATTAVNDANKTIASAEVEITDDMKSTAQSTLSSYKSLYGDTFTSYLEQQNMTEDEYVNDYLIPSQQAEKLTAKYIDENFDEVCDSYQVVKATILEFTSQDDANAALAELKSGSKTAAEAASGHNSSSTGTSTIYTLSSTDVNSMVRTVITSASPDDGWSMVPEDTGTSYAVVKVDDNTPSNFKDEAITTLSSIDNVSSAATTYFFKKYKFVIYDKTIYDGVKADHPDNLVQDMTD
jgi:hypothetical protein